ncbi:MAG: Clp protease N-terminal domain-containing protein [Actinomycetota bacterium]
MGSPTGERPTIPRDIWGNVVSAARRLRRQVAGDDLFLLALAELSGDHPAKHALEAEGVDARRLSTEIRTGGDGPSDPEAGVIFSPAYYLMHGRAEGFAAALGDGTITPEHVLIALLWDPVSASSQLLWRLGVSRDRIVERLRDAGVPLPPAKFPSQREIETGERVWFDRGDVHTVLDHLRLNIPAETSWGFNYEGDRAWAIAETSVDLSALVEQALAP